MYVLRTMSKKTNQSRKSWKSRNSLTLLKELHSNIFIVFKHSCFLKYWSYDIINMCKRLSLNFYTFPLFFNLFGWKIRNFWNIKKSEKSWNVEEKIWKFPQKTEIWKSLLFVLKNLKFWKPEKILKVLKRILKSEKSRNFWKNL